MTYVLAIVFALHLRCYPRMPDLIVTCGHGSSLCRCSVGSPWPGRPWVVWVHDFPADYRCDMAAPLPRARLT